MTVSEMMYRMSAEEFSRWQIWHSKIEPFGELRADLRAGLVAAPLINLLRGALHKNPEWVKASDWILDLLAPPSKPKNKPQTAKQMRELLQGIAGAWGGNSASKAPDRSSRPRKANG